MDAADWLSRILEMFFEAHSEHTGYCKLQGTGKFRLVGWLKGNLFTFALVSDWEVYR